ncbi:MAG: O-antigen ligase family protein [PVC group bacterium]|nr:O-antigen ligase family protein [PVC group bacterium]
MALLGLFTYLFNLYVRPQDWMPALRGLPVDYIVISATLFFALLRRMVLKDYLTVKLPHYYFVSAFVLMIFVSNLAHGHVSTGIFQTMGFLKYLIIFSMFPLIIISPRQMSWTLKCILVLSVALAYQGVYQSLHSGIGWAGQSWYSNWVRQGFHRITWVGQWDGANIYSFILLIAIPFTLEYIFSKKQLLIKLLNFVFFGVIVYTVYLTNSRGGYLALMATLCVYFFVKFKRKAIIIPFVLIIMLMAIKFAPSRMAQLNTTEASAYHRTWVWKQGVVMLTKNPLFGVGKGFFERYSYRGLRAHNSFVQTFAETGLIGFFFWIGMIYYCLKVLLQVMNLKQEPSNERFISEARALFCSFIAFKVCAMFLTIESAILFVWFGLCTAFANVAAKNIQGLKIDFTKHDVKNILLGMVGVIVVIYIIAYVRII